MGGLVELSWLLSMSANSFAVSADRPMAGRSSTTATARFSVSHTIQRCFGAFLTEYLIQVKTTARLSVPKPSGNARTKDGCKKPGRPSQLSDSSRLAEQIGPCAPPIAAAISDREVFIKLARVVFPFAAALKILVRQLAKRMISDPCGNGLQAHSKFANIRLDADLRLPDLYKIDFSQ